MTMTAQSTATLKELLETATTAEETARQANTDLDVALEALESARTGVAPPPRAAPAEEEDDAAASGPPRKKKATNGRRKKSGTVSSSAPKKRGAKKKGAKVTATATASSKGKEKGLNEFGKPFLSSLKAAIFHALDREKWAMLKLPKDADFALTVGEIYQVIVHDDLWRSGKGKGENFTGQISTEIQKLRKDGKVARGENLRYYVVSGATYDGPKLDEDGKPREDQS